MWPRSRTPSWTGVSRSCLNSTTLEWCNRRRSLNLIWNTFGSNSRWYSQLFPNYSLNLNCSDQLSSGLICMSWPGPMAGLCLLLFWCRSLISWTTTRIPSPIFSSIARRKSDASLKATMWRSPSTWTVPWSATSVRGMSVKPNWCLNWPRPNTIASSKMSRFQSLQGSGMK